MLENSDWYLNVYKKQGSTGAELRCNLNTDINDLIIIPNCEMEPRIYSINFCLYEIQKEMSFLIFK